MLKRQLSAYYQRIERSEQWTVNWRQIQIDLEHLLPELLDLEVREALISGGAPTVGISVPYGGLPWAEGFEVTEEDAGAIRERLLRDPEIRFRIEGMIRVQGSQHGYLSGIKADAEATLATVEAVVRR